MFKQVWYNIGKNMFKQVILCDIRIDNKRQENQRAAAVFGQEAQNGRFQR